PPHALVDVAIEVVVQAGRAAARRSTPDEGRGKQAERRNATFREEHPAERCQEQERHDRGLREGHEIANERALPCRRAPGDRGERHDAAPQQTCCGWVRSEGPWRELRQRV